MKRNAIIISILGLVILVRGPIYGQNFNLESPNKKIKLRVENGDSLTFFIENEVGNVLCHSFISMNIRDHQLFGGKAEIKSHNIASYEREILREIPTKNKKLKDYYSELDLVFKGDYELQFRIYDDAVAFRTITHFKDSIIIDNESWTLDFNEDDKGYFSFLEGQDNISDRWMTSYEKVYSEGRIGSEDYETRVFELPSLVVVKNGNKLLLTESGLRDYPGLYFKNEGKGRISSIFPPRVKKTIKNVRGRPNWDRTIRPREVYDYIAKTSGARSFPWRIIGIAKEDKDLLNNEIVYKLADPSLLENTDWIKPGQVAWDWWNNWNIKDVDFKAGINNSTYKEYIDFASRNNIPYIIMDDGWYELGNLTKEVEGIDVSELSKYAEEKEVGIILWCSWATLRAQMDEALDLFQRWGIKGIKVDFMDRDDQAVVDFYWNLAEAAADRHLLVDFHGSHKPTGLERTFPNVINYEGVAGMEQSKWTDEKGTPEMAVSIPFIRMFTGPMDYTPGAMDNASKENFEPIYNNPMSQGTRCHQIAMYILYDAPLQMLSDSPSKYEREKETLDFLTEIPTVWDETIPLGGKIGEFVVLGRKKGYEYFVGAMTNWEERDLSIDFSFLPPGEWSIEIFKDGANADRNGTDYSKEIKKIRKESKLWIHLAPGGGWAAKIYR